MYRAFQGANGWYVAFQRSDGSHKAPAAFQAERFMSQARAEREADVANRDDQDDQRDNP